MVIQQMNNHKAKLQDYAAKTKFNKHRIEIPFLNEEGIIPIGICEKANCIISKFPKNSTIN